MASPNLEQMALLLLERNPQIANSPQGQKFIGILKSKNVAEGEEMARNFCQSYGETPEEALQKAKQFFNI